MLRALYHGKCYSSELKNVIWSRSYKALCKSLVVVLRLPDEAPLCGECDGSFLLRRLQQQIEQSDSELFLILRAVFADRSAFVGLRQGVYSAIVIASLHEQPAKAVKLLYIK